MSLKSCVEREAVSGGSMGWGNPPDVDLQAPGKTLLASAVGSLEQLDVSFLSTSLWQISHMCPVLPLGAETSARVGGNG